MTKHLPLIALLWALAPSADLAHAQLITPTAVQITETEAPKPLATEAADAPVQLAPAVKNTPQQAPSQSQPPKQQQQTVRQMESRPVAALQVLDKVSARVTTLRVPVGQSAAFGLIHITVRSCQVALPADMPEAVAFLEIGEINPRRLGQIATTSADQLPLDRQQVFSGWMFASSPAISALEHPTYDVVVLGCSAGVDEKSPIEQRVTPQAAPATADDAAASPQAGEESDLQNIDD